MQMKKFFLLILILFGIVFTASFFVKKDYQVITAEYDEYNLYPKDCYVFYKGRKYLFDSKLVYKYQVLVKKIVPAVKGILVKNFDSENHYMKEDKGFRILNLRDIDSDKIKYNSKIYTVERRIGDSIFCRIDKDKIIVFIEKENLD